MQQLKKIAITTGDIDGIGLEVTLKALKSVLPNTSKFQFIIYHASSGGLLKDFPENSKNLIENIRKDSPAHWVYEAALKCKDGEFDALVTGPLSKTEIKAAGYNVVGHTQLFEDMFQIKDLLMAFVGSKFSVVLVTGHLPLQSVSGALSEELLTRSIDLAKQLCDKLLHTTSPIALLGVNPHSGEQGLIGKEEQQFFLPVIEKMTKKNILVEGPLVPDAAFLPKNWSKYSVFVCPYHDQGLIPFKLVHGQDSGAHITLGLPIVRTSVDHGTAKEIFGKDLANPNSMIDAIECAMKLVNSQTAKK